jgi:hypothetical protein
MMEMMLRYQRRNERRGVVHATRLFILAVNAVLAQVPLLRCRNMPRRRRAQSTMRRRTMNY